MQQREPTGNNSPLLRYDVEIKHFSSSRFLLRAAKGFETKAGGHGPVAPLGVSTVVTIGLLSLFS